MAKTALTTEAELLIAQAQGTKVGCTAATLTRASGNGMPMQKASGATKTVVAPNLISGEVALNRLRMGSSAAIYLVAISQNPTTAKTMPWAGRARGLKRWAEVVPSGANMRKEVSTATAE